MGNRAQSLNKMEKMFLYDDTNTNIPYLTLDLSDSFIGEFNQKCGFEQISSLDDELFLTIPQMQHVRSRKSVFFSRIM